VIVNVTQLGLNSKRRFKIRHGITYEQDALLTRITRPGGFETLDLIGRSVVLAFRLSGIAAEFPCITTQRDIVEAAGVYHGAQFRRWHPGAEESLRYFKGERWGTRSLYISIDARSRASSVKTVLKRARAALRKAEGQASVDDADLAFVESLNQGLMTGPEWSRDVAKGYADFVEDGLYKNLKRVISVLEESPEGK
jgi:hypothetical protein